MHSPLPDASRAADAEQGPSHLLQDGLQVARRLRRRPRRGLARAVLTVGLTMAVALCAIWTALAVTPMQEVGTVGQVVQVGAIGPVWGWSGPGELDLFGQELATQVTFAGPVRPRLEVTRITLDEQVASYLSQGTTALQQDLGQALARGWVRYVAAQTACAGAVAVLLAGAAAGWFRLRRRGTVLAVAGGTVVTVLLDLALVAVSASSVPQALSQVTSLESLVGAADASLPVPARGGTDEAVQVLVLGDSTAAGAGNPVEADADGQDVLCERSSAAYAQVLAQTNTWTVQNLACAGATVEAGMLGAQSVNGTKVAAQLATAQKYTAVDLVIVSVGANDVQWDRMLEFCAVLDCQDSATTAYFQQKLSDFSTSYYKLLKVLDDLPGSPRVLVNLYYDPFDDDLSCLEQVGVTQDKVDVMRERLAALNGVLRAGAEASSSVVAEPDFTGHGLCTDVPYVQDLDDGAPLHPNAAGELAIALADLQAYSEALAEESVSGPATASTGTASTSAAIGTASP